MALVTISRNKEKISDEELAPIRIGLASVISEALGSEIEDVDVWIRETHPLDLNPGNFDLQVLIFAEHLPELEQNLEERVRKVTDWLQSELSHGVEGYVWAMLQNSSSFLMFEAAGQAVLP